jgi:hypothetical protein
MQSLRPQPAKFLSVIIVCTLLGLLAAASDSAVLTSTGSVALNGAGAPTTTAIFSGDTVRTSVGSAVTISAPGSTVLVPQNSQLTFKGGSVNLSSGKATITTTRGMSVATDQYVISPGSQGTAQYELEKTGDSLLVHPTKGVVTIQSAGKTLTIAEGQVGRLNRPAGPSSSPEVNSLGSSSLSTSTFGNLQDSLGGGDSSKIPVCPNIARCKVPPSVSGHKPCRCIHF